MRLVLLPFGEGAMCECSALFPSEEAARGHVHADRSVPVIPGDSMRHSRPDYVPVQFSYVRTAPRPRLALWLRIVLAALFVGAVVTVMFLVASAFPAAPGCGRACAPATFVTPAGGTTP